MDTGFELFPEKGSTIAPRIDSLFAFEVVVSVFFTALICILILAFAIKYRHTKEEPRREPATSYLLEVIWTVIPLGLTMVMFGWGAKIYFDLSQTPTGGRQVYVVGRQWMWKLQHPEGKREIDRLHVPVGQTVKLKMISEDVIHSFYIPDFRVKMDVLPGRYTSLWFTPTQTGRHHLFCAEYCGTGHSEMIGEVVVQKPREFSEWLNRQRREPAEVIGERLFRRHRCDNCHKEGPQGRGPALHGLFGQHVPLKGGGTVAADESYIRESILKPNAKTVRGYPSIMPTFEDQLSEAEILQIIAYIQSLQRTDQAGE